MIDEVLIPTVVGVESFEDPAELDLFPAEAEVVAPAVPARRREFATVRRCARLALRQLGVAASPLLPGDGGAPNWPDGIVGSMTHCTGYRAAAVARARDVRAIGIDAEPHGPLPEGVLDLASRPVEQHQLQALTERRPELHWDRILFSAKESVYKAWYPTAQSWLGFEEAELTIGGAGTFRARMLVPGPWDQLTGRWVVGRGLVLTAVTVINDAGDDAVDPG